MILFAIFPIKTISEANQREHWAAKSKRSAEQKDAAYLYAYKNFGVSPLPDGASVQLELTRIASRKLDKDNLYGAFKHVTDGICKWLGIDDGDKRFTLICTQRVESKITPVVEVRITIL